MILLAEGFSEIVGCSPENVYIFKPGRDIHLNVGKFAVT